MKPTRIPDLLALAVIAALLANLVFRLSYSTLPGFPLLGGATLGVLGIAEALAGRAIRARIRHEPGTRPVQPLVAARAVLLAKASAVAGAIMAGVWAGMLTYVLPRSAQVAAAGADALSAVVGLVCAIGLVAGALWLERCCRVPDDQDQNDPPAA